MPILKTLGPTLDVFFVTRFLITWAIREGDSLRLHPPRPLAEGSQAAIPRRPG